MGRIEILDKLDRELEKDIHEECQVVFILSRIRKVLEINNQKGKYKYLNFYSNWVLHSKLERQQTTKLLTDLFEPDIDNVRSGKENAIRLKSNHASFFKLSSLKKELYGFLEDNKLSLNLINRNWGIFIEVLLGIIKECPIEFSSKILKKLELVRSENGDYCYKFSLVGGTDMPIIKLKRK